MSGLPSGIVEHTDERVQALAASLKTHGADGAQMLLVLGSGLGAFAERMTSATVVPYAELDAMPRSTVPGHAGQLVIGEIGGVRVCVQQGRVHLYEGWSASEVTRAVRAFAAVGCAGLLLTNAAGGLRADWPPGTLMRITDHLNVQASTPLVATERASGTPYDPARGEALQRTAEAVGVRLEQGVYAGLLGPSYETPAEIEMVRWMGADAVGMSTVAEAATGYACGMRVTAVSCITNYGAGIGGEPLNHAEVVEVGKRVADDFSALLEAAVPELARTE